MNLIIQEYLQSNIQRIIFKKVAERPLDLGNILNRVHEGEVSGFDIEDTTPISNSHIFCHGQHECEDKTEESE